MIKKLIQRSIEEGNRSICSLLDPNPKAKFVDLGCWNGERTLRFANTLGTKDILGLDVKDFGVPFRFVPCDIEKGIPLEDNTYDVVTARYIIEHVCHTDLFVKEIRRILKPGGYTVITAPNMASGRIIVELLLNRQPKEAHVSDMFLIRGDVKEEKAHEGFLHKRLFTEESLRKLLTFHGFKVEVLKRMGYGALPIKFPRNMYAANLLAKARK